MALNRPADVQRGRQSVQCGEPCARQQAVVHGRAAEFAARSGADLQRRADERRGGGWHPAVGTCGDRPVQDQAGKRHEERERGRMPALLGAGHIVVL